MKYFNENQHICKLTYPKKLKLFLSKKKSHFLKIGIFYKKDNHFQW